MSVTQKLSSISAFIPCYNEEKNLKPMIDAFLAVLPQIALKYEIIIINDGSRDRTGKIADTLAQSNPKIKVIHHPANLGYGLSLRSGFTAAQFEWTFFTDGDRQFNLSELHSFIPYTHDYSVIIGFRHKRAEGGLRSFNARLFKLFIDLLFRVHVKDIDCAFKLIRTDLLHSIEFTSTGAMISSELLYRLKKKHQPFKQLPVTHYPRTWGKPTGSNLGVIARAGFEAITLYLDMKFGIHL